MSRLVDPTICPDCRASLDSTGTCSDCGLRLQGPLAAELWTAMVGADRIVEQLRVAGATAGTATPVTAQTPTTTATATAPAATPAGNPAAGPAAALPDRPLPQHPLPQYPTPARPAPAPRPRRLPSASVPVVLLSLGALCLLVAAIVFVAVTWSLLGLTGRTLVLLGFTGLLAGAAVVLSRRGLRGAAETFWLVVAGMLTVDLLAAQSADLAGLGALDWRGTSALVGGALLALGVGAGTWARRQPVEHLYGVQLAGAAGALLLCASNAWGAADEAVGTTIAIPLLVGLAVALRRQVPLTAYALGGLAGASWLVLVGIGWDRALETATLSDWWGDLRGWPLVVASLLAATAVHLRGVPDRARPVAAGLALVPLVMLANAPLGVGSLTSDLVRASATLAVLALVARFAPQSWSRGSAVLTSLGVLGLGLYLVLAPLLLLADLATDGSSPVDLLLVDLGERPSAWTAVVVAVTVAGALACLVRHVPQSGRPMATHAAVVLAAGVVALGGLVLVLDLEPLLWTAVLAGALATAIAGGAAWWFREDLVPAALGTTAAAYLAVITLYAASASDLLTAITASVLAVVLVTVFALREGEGSDLAAGAAASLAALLGGYALLSWGLVLDADTQARAIALSAYAAVVGVLASPATRRAVARVSLELSAAVVAVFAVGYSGDDRTAAMALTIVGSGICLVAVTNRDRLVVGWLGAAVLGAATVIRVAEDVRAPELYTLPAAALLILAGVWRLRTDPGTSSFTALGSGVTLALLPSLLLALDEPVSLRGALVGLAGVLALAAGVHQRLAAPFVLGALTTGILALRHLQPIAEAVPRWISLGLVGVVLLLVGVTWEARRRNAETAGRYLTALR